MKFRAWYDTSLFHSEKESSKMCTYWIRINRQHGALRPPCESRQKRVSSLVDFLTVEGLNLTLKKPSKTVWAPHRAAKCTVVLTNFTFSTKQKPPQNNPQECFKILREEISKACRLKLLKLCQIIKPTSVLWLTFALWKQAWRDNKFMQVITVNTSLQIVFMLSTATIIKVIFKL